MDIKIMTNYIVALNIFLFEIYVIIAYILYN